MPNYFFTFWAHRYVGITAERPFLHNQAERDQAINELKHGKLKVIFTCDLFNEGVDVPDINTLLLLRPTQSPVVFQQQIGRGLRLFPGKGGCLVLDFIGTYSQDFRFDVLLRSLTGQSRAAIKEFVDKGFGLLPTGCHIQFDRVARERVLESLKFELNLNVNRLTAKLVAWANVKDKTQIKLKDFLIENEIELSNIYSANHYWSEFKRRAHLPTRSKGPREDALSRRIIKWTPLSRQFFIEFKRVSSLLQLIGAVPLLHLKSPVYH